MSRLRWAVVITLSVLVMGWHAVLTRPFSLGVSPDSVNYLSAAQSLMEGRGFRGYNGEPLVDFAPLYPAAIALVSRVSSLELLESARWLNALIAGICTGLVSALILTYVRNGILGALGIALLVASEPLWWVYLHAWSEPLFILESILFIIAGTAYLRDPTPLRLMGFSLTGALCVLTRYGGLFVIPLGALMILTARASGWRKRLFDSTVYAGLCCASIGAWFVRNYRASGTFAGERAPSSVTFGENLRLTALVVKGWFVPRDEASGRVLAPLLTISVAVVAVVLLVSFVKNPQSLSLLRQSLREPMALTALLFSLFCVLWLAGSAAVTAVDPINNRLLSTFFAPALLAVLSVADRLLRILPRPNLTLATTVAVLGLATAGGWAETTTIWQTHRTEGGRYTSRVWRQSPTLAFCRTMRVDRPVFTNAPELLYFATGIRADIAPAWRYYRSRQPIPGALDEFRESIRDAGGSVILVWLGEENRTFVYSVEDLRRVFTVAPVAEFEDGGVYVVSERDAGGRLK